MLSAWSNVFMQGGSPSIPAPTATATMTQLANANQIYQRDTLTGGGQGKGQGTIPVAFSALTVAGKLNFRCSSGGSTRGDIQSETAGPTVASTGAQTVNFTGIDARLGWFYLDIRDANGWQNGSTLIGMGDLTAMSGQSLMTAFQKAQTSDSTVIGTIDPNIKQFTTYETYNPTSLPVWESPVANNSAATHYNGTPAADYLRLMAAANGCNQGLIGHSVSGTPQMNWQPLPAGNANYTQFASVVAAAGGKWRYEIWGQGHQDVASSVRGNQYYADMDYRVFGAATGSYSSLNSYGGTVQRLVFTVPSLHYSDPLRYGTVRMINDLRRGAKAWCAARGAVYVDMHDLTQYDGIHEQNDTSPGPDHMAAALFRAAQSDNAGPLITSATRSAWDGTKTVISATLTNLGSALVGSGNWWERFVPLVQGSMQNAYAFSSGSIVDATHITLTITAQNPGDGQVIDLYAVPAILADNSGTAGAANDNRSKILRDNRTADGIPYGRGIQPNTTPVTVAAPTPGGGTNAPTGAVGPYSYQDITLTSPTYAAAEAVTGWGLPLNGGSGVSKSNGSSSGFPASITGWITIPSTVSANTIVFGTSSGINLVLRTNRALFLNYPGGTLSSGGALAAGTYYFWAVLDANGVRIYTSTGPGVNGTLYASSGTTTTKKYAAANMTMNVGTVSSCNIFGCAYWNSSIWPSGGPTLAAPTTPYTGTEGMINYYPFTSTSGGADSVRGA